MRRQLNRRPFLAAGAQAHKRGCAVLAVGLLGACAGAPPAAVTASGGDRAAVVVEPVGAVAPPPASPRALAPARPGAGPRRPPAVLPDGRMLVVAPPARVPRAFWATEHAARASHTTFRRPMVAGEEVYSLWLRGGRTAEREAPRGITGRTAIRVPKGAPLVVEVATPRHPTRVDVLFFRSLGRSGVPVGRLAGASCEIGHTAEEFPCVYTAADRVTVHARMPSSARVALVNAGWYVPALMRERDENLSPEVSASWAFVLDRRRPRPDTTLTRLHDLEADDHN